MASNLIAASNGPGFRLPNSSQVDAGLVGPVEQTYVSVTALHSTIRFIQLKARERSRNLAMPAKRNRTFRFQTSGAKEGIADAAWSTSCARDGATPCTPFGSSIQKK